MKRQHATSMPTPSSSSNVPSTPRSTQGSSVDGALGSQPRSVSSSGGRMLPPAVPASPSSVRSSSYASASSLLVPTYYSATSAPDAIATSNQVYQNAERDQTSRAASPLPLVHYSGYPPERQRQRPTGALAPSHNSRGYSELDQNAPLMPAVSGSPSSIVQPASVNQEASQPNTASRVPTRSRLMNPQGRSTYEQNQNDSSDQMATQRSNMIHDAPEQQEEIAQLKQQMQQQMQMVSALCAGLGVAIPPPVPSQANLLPPFEGQLSWPMLSPPRRAREIEQDTTHGSHSMDPSNSSQIMHQFNSQRPGTSHTQGTSQGEASTPTMQPPQRFQDATMQRPSQTYYQSQPGSDDSDFSFFDDFTSDEVRRLVDGEPNWNAIPDSSNVGMHSDFVRLGERGEGGNL
jgi:hypothetical protein